MSRSVSAILIVMMFLLAGCASTRGELESPTSGDLAQDFTLPDQNGEMVTLSSVLTKHKGAVVAFYPKDDSKN